jgi:DNA-directed RNA polymerase specialized sigma24 family protein
MMTDPARDQWARRWRLRLANLRAPGSSPPPLGREPVTADDDHFPQTRTRDVVPPQGDDAAIAEWRDQFVRRYYAPVFAYMTALTRGSEKAEDLTQGFFTDKVVSGRLLSCYQRGRGSFRPYLKQALRNYARSASSGLAERVQTESIDDAEPPPVELGGLLEAESAFHRAWVSSLVADALERVWRSSAAKNQTVHRELFSAWYLEPRDQRQSWRELGARYGLDEKAAQQRAKTVALQFRDEVFAILRERLGSEKAAQEELATLRELL